MEDFAIDLVIGKGPSARTMRLLLPPFTLVGATTRAGLVSAPLRDRFGMHYYFEFYEASDLVTIVLRSADILGVRVSADGAEAIASRSRGTPRIANRLLRRCRDYAQVQADGVVDRGRAQEAMDLLEIDSLGLDEFDRKYLRLLLHKYDGGPVGVETLAAALSEERDTIEDTCESYLLQIGFLQRTPRGRVATRLASEHLGIPPKQGASVLQTSLL
jgi:Holliday junction DNA helicase RuvB